MLKASLDTTATTGRPSRLTAKIAPSASPPRSPNILSKPSRYDDPKVLARLAALPDLPMADLKQQWRDLFAAEPPPYNRRYIESRLSYRIQELAFGGLSEQTRKRLEAIGEDLEAAKSAPAGKRGAGGPIAGTRLVRDWQGTELSSVLQFSLKVGFENSLIGIPFGSFRRG